MLVLKKKAFFSASWLSLFIVSSILVFTNFNLARWKEKKVIQWDVVNYYDYLPAVFIHQDLSLSFFNDKRQYYLDHMQFWPGRTPNGGNVIKTTMGLSFLYLPFFLAAHSSATLLSLDTSGFSELYHFSIALATLFFAFLGLYYLRKILLRKWSEEVSSLCILALGLGTNYFNYATYEAGMSHVFNFALFAIFTWSTFSYFEKPSLRTSIKIGLLLGLITLIRPTNGVVILFFLLYPFHSAKTIRALLQLYWQQKKYLLIICVSSILVVLPQLFYWKYITGDWFFNSYIGERFFFSQPHIIDGLFSYRKGWLIYTPVMVFSLIGFYFLYERNRELFWPCLLCFVANVYLVFSWWCWWYGGSFGMRALIDCYPILALSLAAFIHAVYDPLRPVFRNFSLYIIVAFISINLFQSSQYRYGAIHYDAMTKEAYWHAFGRLKPDSKHYELIKAPDYGKAVEGMDEY